MILGWIELARGSMESLVDGEGNEPLGLRQIPYCRSRESRRNCRYPYLFLRESRSMARYPYRFAGKAS